MDFASVLVRMVSFFRGEGCSFAVVGAFGLHAYGLSRATGDLDFVVDAVCRERLILFLESLGYETLYASSGYSNHLHSDNALGRVDISYVRDDTSISLFAGATQTFMVQGLAVPVPRPEHLAAMKILAMKNDPSRTLQELADIQFLLGLPGIDEEEIHGYFKRHGIEEHYHAIRKYLDTDNS